MKHYLSKFPQSVQEMKHLSVLTIGAMLTALFVLSSVFLDFYPSDTIKISFGFLFIAIAAYLFGPAPAMLVGGLGDFLTWVVKPHGALNIGITISMATIGLIWGMFYYKEKPSLVRCIIAVITETVLVELLLKTYSLKMMYGMPFTATLITRLLPAGIMLVIMCVLSFSAFKLVEPLKADLNRSGRVRRR